jgi:hypothetical protein
MCMADSMPLLVLPSQKNFITSQSSRFVYVCVSVNVSSKK